MARKYDSLQPHLEANKLAEFEMTFAQIEQVIGAPLPKSANDPQFWANTTTVRTSLRKAIASAGFAAFLISSSKRVRFQRVR